MATANNAPLTNQGRADLRRAPTFSQVAFNQNRSSQISALNADLFVVNEEGKQNPALFDPITVSESTGDEEQTRLSVFLWMTDRVLVSRATQRYPEMVYPLGGGVPLGTNLITEASEFAPTNGMAALPPNVTCLPQGGLADYGAQYVLSNGSGPQSLSVRGTPMLLTLAYNTFFDPNDPATRRLCRVSVSALSESLLSGTHQVRWAAPAPNGEVDLYSATGAGRRQILLPLAQYLFGQYWLQDNIAGVPGVDADIVGVYTQPPLP